MKLVERILHLDGKLSEFLVASSGSRFLRCFTESDGSYAEYFLETPNELHSFTTSEMISVLRKGDFCIGFYSGELFVIDTFRSEGGNWDGTVSVC